MTTSLPLTGRVAMVAGAVGPLGRAVAVALAEAGADLALSVGAQDDAAMFAMNSIANELWALDRRQLALTIDATDPQSAGAAVEQVVAHLGRLDLLVTLPPPAVDGGAPLSEADPAALAATLQRRLTGVLLLCRAAGAAMPERGGILNVTAPNESAAGAAAEAGILGLTQPLAREWAGRVAVNAVRLRDGGDPASVAALAVLLANELSAAHEGAVTGQIFEL